MTNRHDSGAEPPPGLDETPAVPLEFAAFCELHRPRYLSYARVWLPERAEAADAVQQAFAEIAVHWRELLGSSNPTAHAWQILRETVAAHSTGGPVGAGSTGSGGPAADGLTTDGPAADGRNADGRSADGGTGSGRGAYLSTVDRADRPPDDDLAILHYVVGLAAPEIADVIGTDTASVAGRLRRTMLREASGW
ncbi:hypothetical protein [Kitasatospora sp. A2-31]|uniref:hypothetical protein n=1 Tax=Kitasatospora sp. A2-31 TaxID=2916414 RepID=UPI001EEBE2D7|nr:hypothetical protein [Kitasatospora sp. A2-31]MCG6496312.1 hypothetical protein [Kitasatospora sp. A2-31]